jgi:putative ABC transport system permease protein
LAYLVATQVFELPYKFSPAIWLAGVSAGVLIVCVSGYFAARGAVNARPADVLRGANA